jgi:D-sedoheptulose 7-phosphate isomerase
LDQIESLGLKAKNTINSGGKIILAGNGGSFADAQHICAEFVSKLNYDRKPLAAITLGVNGSNISALANDYGYEHVFSRELEALGRSDDLLIAISTSGNSKNIINLIKVATTLNINSILLTGDNGGQASKLTSSIKVPSNVTMHIQEAHINIGHIICSIAQGDDSNG